MKLSYLTIRSRCDYCRKNITILETIPILALFLRGISRCCNRRIEPTWGVTFFDSYILHILFTA
ncbi:prepilin peptidase [Staphylococcus xylosus]|uniref:Prepilin peptidase n=1 Tax=Staphylococcus xylosus TaxID=1288 RepID=A0A939NCH4_STAXY|nr:prepilin peptidase [Staphylococcus xylosus]